MTEVQTQVTMNTEALKGAQTEVNELRRQIQTLEIELESQKSLVRKNTAAFCSAEHTHTHTHQLACPNTVCHGPDSALSFQLSLINSVDTGFTLQ